MIGTLNGHSRDLAPLMDRDAEMAVIGSIVLDTERFPEVAAIVKPRHFADPGMRKIARVIWDMSHEGKPLEPRFVESTLSELGLLCELQGYFLESRDSVITTVHAAHLAKTVRDLAERRLALNSLDVAHDRLKNGEPPSDVLSELADAIQAEADREPLSIFNPITAAELASGEFVLEYLIEGVLVKGQPCGIYGPKKALKTSIALDLAISLARGGYFLGRFKVQSPVRVAVFSGESGLPTLQETARRICAAAFCELSDVQNLLFCDRVPQFNAPKHVDELRRFIKAQAIEVLVIDPAFLAFSANGSEGNLFAMGAVLRPIAELCQEFGTTLIVLHHLRKNRQEQYAPADLDDASQSGWAEFSRQWLLLSRREAYGPGSGDHKLWLGVGGSAGHSGLWGLDVSEGVGHGQRHWNVNLVDAGDIAEQTRQSAADSRQQRAAEKATEKVAGDKAIILAAMAKLPDHTGTKRKLRDQTGLSHARFTAAFNELFDAGDIIDAGQIPKGNGQSYEAYRLAE